MSERHKREDQRGEIAEQGGEQQRCGMEPARHIQRQEALDRRGRREWRGGGKQKADGDADAGDDQNLDEIDKSGEIA